METKNENAIYDWDKKITNIDLNQSELKLKQLVTNYSSIFYILMLTWIHVYCSVYTLYSIPFMKQIFLLFGCKKPIQIQSLGSRILIRKSKISYKILVTWYYMDKRFLYLNLKFCRPITSLLVWSPSCSSFSFLTVPTFDSYSYLHTVSSNSF